MITPPHLSLLKSAKHSSHFFQTKINNIYSSLNNSSFSPNSLPSSPPITNQPQFTSVLPTKLPTILSGIKTSSYTLDHISSKLIMNCLPAISPLITNRIKSSFTSGSVPQILKVAAVTSKKNLDSTLMSQKAFSSSPISPSCQNSEPTSTPITFLKPLSLASAQSMALKQPSSKSQMTFSSTLTLDTSPFSFFLTWQQPSTPSITPSCSPDWKHLSSSSA